MSRRCAACITSPRSKCSCARPSWIWFDWPRQPALRWSSSSQSSALAGDGDRIALLTIVLEFNGMYIFATWQCYTLYDHKLEGCCCCRCWAKPEILEHATGLREAGTEWLILSYAFILFCIYGPQFICRFYICGPLRSNLKTHASGYGASLALQRINHKNNYGLQIFGSKLFKHNHRLFPRAFPFCSPFCGPLHLKPHSV